MTTLVALVAEDEPAIRTIAAEALTEAGFRVIEAADAGEALAALEAQGDSIDALFTDYQLPGPLDGLGLADRVRNQWPWVKLLMTSGFGRPSNDVGFLQKPYDIRRMPVRLRELIVAA